MNDNQAVTLSPLKKIKFNRILPYWAVFQSDLQQTIHSWLYRIWVFLSVLVAVGYVLYRFGAYREAGMIQTASELMTDLMRWLVLGSMTLIIVLTAGCISSERGTIADSVLSRGISRVQYFLGKWHSRLIAILGTFLVLSALVLIASFFLLRDERLSLLGCGIALINICALLVVVITCSVSVSAMSNSTLLNVALVWMLLYGVGFLLSLLPATFPSPDRILRLLPNVLCGYYDWQTTLRLVLWSLGGSMFLAIIGMVSFSRRDI